MDSRKIKPKNMFEEARSNESAFPIISISHIPFNSKSDLLVLTLAGECQREKINNLLNLHESYLISEGVERPFMHRYEDKKFYIATKDKETETNLLNFLFLNKVSAIDPHAKANDYKRA